MPVRIFGVIAPRNDTTITSRCTNGNRFLDGHVFQHHGVMTFFRNYRDHRPLVSSIERLGGRLVSDMSVYRHVCLLGEPCDDEYDFVTRTDLSEPALERRPLEVASSLASTG